MCGQNGHIASRCPQGEESKLNKEKKSAVYAQKGKQVKKEHSGLIFCLRCKSKTHVTERCLNLTLRDTAQQYQLEESSLDSFSTSSENEFQVNMGQYSDSDTSECSCLDPEEYTCHVFYEEDFAYSTSSSEEEEVKPPKEKVLMASTEEEAELKILSQIRIMEEGDMKNRLIEAFTDQLKAKASKESGKKPLFVNASYERNTKSFQMHHQKPGKVRSLTLGEVSVEIYHLKAEISAIKTQIAEIQKGKHIQEEKEEDSWNPTTYHSELQIAEGKQDPNFGFKDMRLFTITYQQHHVKVKICIQGQTFFMTALIDLGADINILNIKNVLAKYWVATEREVVGLGNKKLKYEIPRASLCFDTHCIYMKFAIADIPVDCILGNVFLATIEPHGSTRVKGNKVGYFISVPTSKGRKKKFELPYVSSPRVSTMVQAMQKLDKAESLLSDLKDLKGTLRMEEQLKFPRVKAKIQELKEEIEEN